MAKGYWTHSKSEKKFFAQTMTSIDEFCREHNIEHIEGGGSYRFSIGKKKYIVSNSAIPKSCRIKGVTYFYASQTRLIDIYNDLKKGYELNSRGQRIGGDDDGTMD